MLERAPFLPPRWCQTGANATCKWQDAITGPGHVGLAWIQWIQCHKPPMTGDVLNPNGWWLEDVYGPVGHRFGPVFVGDLPIGGDAFRLNNWRGNPHMFPRLIHLLHNTDSNPQESNTLGLHSFTISYFGKILLKSYFWGVANHGHSRHSHISRNWNFPSIPLSNCPKVLCQAGTRARKAWDEDQIGVKNKFHQILNSNHGTHFRFVTSAVKKK